jgi:hypothetical protein
VRTRPTATVTVFQGAWARVRHLKEATVQVVLKRPWGCRPPPGTEGSNPLPSSGESSELQSFNGAEGRLRPEVSTNSNTALSSNEGELGEVDLGRRGRFAGPTLGRHQRSRYGHGEDKGRPRAPGNHFILSSSQ